jgi:hypothetical protein
LAASLTSAAEARPARHWLTGETAQVEELLLAGTPHERAPALGALQVLIDESEDWHARSLTFTLS